jgi:hypothetical protein
VGPLKSAEHEDGVDLHKNYINLRVMIIRALNIIFKNARYGFNKKKRKTKKKKKK